MRKQYALIDILKFVAAVCVVLLHVRELAHYNIDTNSLRAVFETMLFVYICRMPVPFFFTVSGYFLFKKVNSSSRPGKVVAAFCKRILILYACWIVMNLYYIIAVKYNWQFPSVKTPLDFMRRFVFHGTFGASWYLVASVIDAAVIYLLTRIDPKNRLALAVSILAYILCMLDSNYRFIVNASGGMIKTGFDAVTKYYGRFYLSFPYGLIFFTMGKLLAEREKEKGLSGKWSAVCVMMILYFVEMSVTAYLVKTATPSRASFAVYPLLMYFLVAACLKNNMKYRNIYLQGRRASTIIYCSHYAILWAMMQLNQTFFRLRGIPMLAVNFILTCIASMMLSFIIIKLSEKWKIFGYLY